MIATGGEDGAIKIYDLLSIVQSKNLIEEEQKNSEMLGNIQNSIRCPMPNGDLPAELIDSSQQKLTKAQK